MRALAPLVLIAVACAANPYDTYKAKNPDWHGEAPTAGASLHETLAGLYAPPVAAYNRFVSKLDVLRLEDGKATLLTEAELEAVLESDAPGDYGLVATLVCLSEVDLQRYHGEKVAWYLFAENRLVAFDHFDFMDRCAFFNQFQPAGPEQEALERPVTAHRDASFPGSMEHAGEFYRKGIAYLGAKRPADAAAMLEAGDRAFDVGSRGERHVDFENAPSTLREMKSPEIDALREALAAGLARSEAAAAPAP
jgi:hypothetical protein